MTKNVISSPAAPAAIGPYSQAIRTGDTLWMSCLLYTSDAADE